MRICTCQKDAELKGLQLWIESLLGEKDRPCARTISLVHTDLVVSKSSNGYQTVWDIMPN